MSKKERVTVDSGTQAASQVPVGVLRSIPVLAAAFRLRSVMYVRVQEDQECVPRYEDHASRLHGISAIPRFLR